MATLEQLEEGIRRAHAAGNADHVKALGAEYRRLQAATVEAKPNLSNLPAPFGQIAGMFGYDGQPRAPDTSKPEEWGPPGALIPVQFKKGTGQPRWAMPGILSSMLDAAKLPGEVLSGNTPFDPRVSMQDQDPATLDQAAMLAGTVGTAPSLAGRNMIPGVAPRLSTNTRHMVGPNGIPMPPLLAKDLRQQGLTPAMVHARLRALGPGAVLGDVSPTLQGRVGAVANTPGGGKDAIVDMMRARAKAANTRIPAALNSTLGPPQVPSRAAAEIAANKAAAAQGYPQVFRDFALGPEMGLLDSAPIAAAIDEVIPLVVGRTRAKIQSVRQMLIDPTTGQLTQDPQIILAVRRELDGMIGAENNATTKGQLADLRTAIDTDLGTNVPGLKSVDAQVEQQGLQQEGFDAGYGALRSTSDAPLHPSELNDLIAAGSVPNHQFIGPSGVPVQIKQGMVAYIARLVGNKANDRVALKQLLLGEGSWNRDKLVAAFGEEKADKIVRLFDNEATMAETESLAFGNSKTENVRSSKAGIETPSSTPGVVQNAANFQFGNAGAKMIDRLLGGHATKKRQLQNARLAAALMGSEWRPGLDTSLRTAAPLLAPTASGVSPGMQEFIKLLTQGRP